MLTSSATDVLSHVAIRARSQKVLLATCFDAAELEALKSKDGQQTTLAVDASGSVAAIESTGTEQVTSPIIGSCRTSQDMLRLKVSVPSCK